MLWQLGPIRITDEGLLVGVSTAMRILALFSFSLLFVMTTDPVAFIQSLIQQSGISYRFGYGVLAAYRFVPLLATEVAQIGAAHHVRGFSPGRDLLVCGANARLRDSVAGFSHASRGSRGAGDGRSGIWRRRQRTYFREQHFGAADLGFGVGSAIVVGGVFFVLYQLGLLGSLNPFQ